MLNTLFAGNFAGNPVFLIAQLINLFIVIVWMWATLKTIFLACRKGSGAEVPLWILVIVFIPILGALAAYLHYKNKGDSQQIERP